MKVKELMQIMTADFVTISYNEKGTVFEDYRTKDAVTKYGEAEIVYAHAVERNHIRIYIYKEA